MKHEGRVERNVSRLGVWAALAGVLLIGCGGGGGSGDPVSAPGPGPPDSVAPAVVSSAPADGATDVAIDASLKITFTEPVDPATVNGTTVKIRAGNTEMAGTVGCVHDTITLTPATNWRFATTYTVTISSGPSGVKDLAGNSLAADHTWTFSTGQASDTTPPTGIATNPINGATGVSVQTSVAAIFSETVTNVSPATFRLAAGGVAVPGSVTTSGSTAIFTPSLSLAYNTTYTVTVTTGVTDLAGNSLAADHTWTFSTGLASDAISPTVTATNPANGATGISVQTTVAAIFSEAVTSVSPATFRLAAGGVAVPGAVTTNGSTAIFTPSAPLAGNTTYTATVTTGVTDLAGNPLRAVVYWTFTTSGMSGLATVISSGADSASGAQLAMDASGTAVAVWVQGNGIWSNRYVPGTGWGGATPISSGAGGAEAPQVAMGGSGTATAVWHQWDGAQNSIYANRYVPGTGWGTATIIKTGAGQAQVAMDASGNAIAVWPQGLGAFWNIYANHYVFGTGWGMETLIQTTSGDAYVPQVAMDNSGNAFAVWMQYDAQSSIYANRYVPGIGWGTATYFDTGSSWDLVPQVAMADSGAAMVVWAGHAGTTLDNSFRVYICANRYIPGSGWETPTFIRFKSSLDVGSPQVAIDVAGNAVVVWVETASASGSYGAVTVSAIAASSYVPGTGWTEPVFIDAPLPWSQAAVPQVAMNRKGNAVAVWGQSAFGRYPRQIYANRYVAGTGWGTADVVETSAEGSYPRVATDGNGNFLIVWPQWDGTRHNISAVRYQVP